MTTYNLVRALARPYVGAHTYNDGRVLKVWRATLPESPLLQEARTLEPGAVFTLNGTGFNVRTGDGYLAVGEYESDEGRSIQIGIRLGAGT